RRTSPFMAGSRAKMCSTGSKITRPGSGRSSAGDLAGNTNCSTSRRAPRLPLLHFTTKPNRQTCSTRPLKTLDLFPTKSTGMKDECSSSKSSSCSTSTN
ncbi:hypothetical protein B296_00029890, partial [Ensete ventricosum]